MNNINKTEEIMKKKIFIKALFGTIVLVSAMLFTGCTSDDNIDGTANNGNATNGPEVPVNFVFNVATSTEPTSRMTSLNTQAALTETFRGIENATLMTYVNKTGDDLNDGKNIATAITAAKMYDFGTVLGSGSLKPSGDGSAAPKSRRVLELSLPAETNTLLFWGKAIKTGTSKQQGEVIWKANSKDLSQISFTAARRIPAGDGINGEQAFHQYQNFVAALINKLVDTRADYNVTFNSVDYSATNFGWKDYVTWNTNHLEAKTTIDWGGEARPITPLGEIMADAFIKLNTIYDGEVRAGSGPALSKLLGDLYEVLQTVASANPTSGGEALTKAVAESLQTTITSMIDHTTGKWKTDMSALKTLSGLLPTETNLLSDNLNNFPQVIFSVPQGATVLKLEIDNKTDDTTRKFTYSYDNQIPSYAMNGDVNAKFDPINYRYPVEICYFGNSPVRVDIASHEVTEFPDGTDDWTNDSKWTGTWVKNSHVSSPTRSVAMQQNINYGTAMLQTTVRYGAAKLKDNNHAIQQARKHTNEPDNEITVSSSTFALTGVMVGGVEPEVGWNYIAKAASPTYSSFIYDNDLPETSIPTYGAGKSAPNYTLVWDNWNPAVPLTDKQNVVYVALEFVNNSGKDFWGMHNLIRNGQTFYITGKLDPDMEGTATPLSTTDRSAGIDWPTDYALPPYNADGTSVNKRRIFIQDYKTIADFVISANSLKAALIDVPDLRSSQISLGLSVDLQWRSGLNFETINLGGLGND